MDLPPENLDGYTFLLLGEKTQITLVDGDKIGYDKGQKRIYLPKKNSRARLVKWLKENAARIFTDVTTAQAKRMNATFSSVSVNAARGSWGLCSAENSIRYTFRLLYCPKEVIEYVVVHELAHTRYKNHSASFWREVERYMPDWKPRRKWLKDHAICMEIF